MDSSSNIDISYLKEVLSDNKGLYRTNLFLLQDIENEDTLSELARGLGSGWTGIKEEGKLGVLFDDNQFQFKKIHKSEGTDILNLLLIDKETGNPIHIVNLCRPGTPEDKVKDLEDYISSFAKRCPFQTRVEPITIVAGHFNFPIPTPSVYPIEEKPLTRCFVRLENEFYQAKRKPLLIDLSQPVSNAHVKSSPLAPWEIPLKKQNADKSLVVFPDKHQLFSMGPTLGNVKRAFPEAKIQLTKDPVYHIATIVTLEFYEIPDSTDCKSNLVGKWIWDCSDVSTQIKIMRLLDEEHPLLVNTPLNGLFNTVENLETLDEDQKEHLERTALAFLSARDDLLCITAQSKIDEVQLQYASTAFLDAEEQLKKLAFDLSSTCKTQCIYAIQIFCSWLKYSLISALLGGIFCSAIVGLCFGTLTIPILGLMAGFIAGAVIGTISGFLIGAGTIGIVKAYQKALDNRLTFFDKGLGESIKIYIEACTSEEVSEEKRREFIDNHYPC